MPLSVLRSYSTPNYYPSVSLKPLYVEALGVLEKLVDQTLMNKDCWRIIFDSLSSHDRVYLCLITTGKYYPEDFQKPFQVFLQIVIEKKQITRKDPVIKEIENFNGEFNTWVTSEKTPESYQLTQFTGEYYTHTWLMLYACVAKLMYRDISEKTLCIWTDILEEITKLEGECHLQIHISQTLLQLTYNKHSAFQTILIAYPQVASKIMDNIFQLKLTGRPKLRNIPHLKNILREQVEEVLTRKSVIDWDFVYFTRIGSVVCLLHPLDRVDFCSQLYQKLSGHKKYFSIQRGYWDKILNSAMKNTFYDINDDLTFTIEPQVFHLMLEKIGQMRNGDLKDRAFSYLFLQFKKVWYLKRYHYLKRNKSRPFVEICDAVCRQSEISFKSRWEFIQWAQGQAQCNSRIQKKFQPLYEYMKNQEVAMRTAKPRYIRLYDKKMRSLPYVGI